MKPPTVIRIEVGTFRGMLILELDRTVIVLNVFCCFYSFIELNIFGFQGQSKNMIWKTGLGKRSREIFLQLWFYL